MPGNYPVDQISVSLCTPPCCQLACPSLQARARLRELHADILARQLAAAEAGVDVRAEMGWDREDREVRLLLFHPLSTVISLELVALQVVCGKSASAPC